MMELSARRMPQLGTILWFSLASRETSLSSLWHIFLQGSPRRVSINRKSGTESKISFSIAGYRRKGKFTVLLRGLPEEEEVHRRRLHFEGICIVRVCTTSRLLQSAIMIRAFTPLYEPTLRRTL